MATNGSALPAGRWTVTATDVVDELYREHALRLTWTGTLTLIGW